MPLLPDKEDVMTFGQGDYVYTVQENWWTLPGRLVVWMGASGGCRFAGSRLCVQPQRAPDGGI